MKRIIKKTLLLLEKTVLNVYENIFITPLFGKKRNVQHIWKPSNYSRIVLFLAFSPKANGKERYISSFDV